MGDVILFQPRGNFARSERAAPLAQDASILFFTGVRYQRDAAPMPNPIEHIAPPKGGMDGAGGRRRKRRG